jgi:hypothetical protein
VALLTSSVPTCRRGMAVQEMRGERRKWTRVLGAAQPPRVFNPPRMTSSRQMAPTMDRWLMVHHVGRPLGQAAAGPRHWWAALDWAKEQQAAGFFTRCTEGRIPTDTNSCFLSSEATRRLLRGPERGLIP